VVLDKLQNDAKIALRHQECQQLAGSSANNAGLRCGFIIGRTYEVNPLEISDRKKKILTAIIGDYVQTADL
jgi:hypothetical protein